MDFYAVLDQVLALLRQRGRVSYRALKRQFDLNDAYLDDLKVEILEVQQCAVDQEGTMLVWTGKEASDAVLAPIQPQAPLAYTPPYLAEKILISRSALEGERKQVTVLFADLKGSMELLAERDPEEARQLLDPVLERMMEAVHRYEGTGEPGHGRRDHGAVRRAAGPRGSCRARVLCRAQDARRSCGATRLSFAAGRAWRCRSTSD